MLPCAHGFLRDDMVKRELLASGLLGAEEAKERGWAESMHPETLAEQSKKFYPTTLARVEESRY